MLSKRACLVLLAAAALALPVSAGDFGKSTNVLITFQIGTRDQGTDVVLKTYEMLVNADWGPVDMSTGAKIPIPTTSFNVSADGTRVAAPLTSFTYQQIGFSANVRARFDENGSVELRGHIEDSSLTGQPAVNGRPFIQSTHQNISATLELGKPVRMTRVDEVELRAFFVQIQADVLSDGGERIAAMQ